MITEHITALLAQLGFGTVGTDIFADHLPNKPDDAVVAFSTGGMSPTFVQDSRVPDTERPSVQIVSRSASLATAKAKMHAIYVALLVHGRNDAIDGVRFIRLTPLQTPFAFERDENDRWKWGVNYTTEKEVEV